MREEVEGVLGFCEGILRLIGGDVVFSKWGDEIVWVRREERNGRWGWRELE